MGFAINMIDIASIAHDLFGNMPANASRINNTPVSIVALPIRNTYESVGINKLVVDLSSATAFLTPTYERASQVHMTRWQQVTL